MSDRGTRHYCFTDFILDEKVLMQLPFSYLCWGEEICPETGKDHFQCYVYLKSCKTFNAIRNILAPRHVKACKGDAESNRSYCQGDHTNHEGKYKPLNDVFKEFGTFPVQGARNDIKKTLALIKTGKTNIREIISTGVSYQSIRLAELQLKYFEPARNHKPLISWFWGPADTGKSKAAALQYPDAYWCMDSTKWWEGYDAHEDVVIDDFRTDFCTWRSLLRLLDRTPYRVECKGGSRQFVAKRIIITCPVPPETLYAYIVHEGEEIYQLLRRISNVREFTRTVAQQIEIDKKTRGNITYNPVTALFKQLS